jgi:hypothetical protein
VIEIIAVVVGFLLGLLPPWLRRKHREAGMLKALRVEVERCGTDARNFLKDGVRAPLYRLPTWIGDVCLPELVSASTMLEGELLALSNFYGIVEQINRGLDRVGDPTIGANDPEVNRLGGKVQQLVSGKDGMLPLFDQAQAAIGTALSRLQRGL